jgi:hypothetical protein
MIGKILPCPQTISETGYIRIVADATMAPGSQSAFAWDYKAVSYDPIKQEKIGLAFDVTKEEVMNLCSPRQNLRLS